MLLLRFQKPPGVEERPGTGRALQSHRLKQCRQEAAYRRVTATQGFGQRVGVRTGQRLHSGDRVAECTLSQPGQHPLPDLPCGDRVVQQDAHRVLQGQCRLIKIPQRPQALASAPGFPAQGQGGHQRIKHVQYVIGGSAFQMLHEDQERRVAALLPHAREGLRPGSAGMPSQLGAPRFGHILQINVADPKQANLFDPLHGRQEGGRRDPGRTGAQHLQTCETFALPQHQQAVQRGPLPGGEPFGQLSIGLTGQPLPNPRNQPGESGHPWQHHLASDQMRCGQIEQHAGPDTAGGDLRIQPADQPERLPLIERLVAEMGQNQLLMLEPGGLPFQVFRQDVGLELQLFGQVLHDHGGNRRGVLLKGAQKTQGTQLERAAQFVVGPPTLGEKGVVVLTEVEGAGELLRGGVTLILAIPRRLFISEKFNRHGVLR